MNKFDPTGFLFKLKTLNQLCKEETSKEKKAFIRRHITYLVSQATKAIERHKKEAKDNDSRNRTN